jgi:hypothetical protein
MLKSGPPVCLLVILFTVVFMFSAPAQFPFSVHYSVNNGLPGSDILDISQDRDAYIWFATTYGLCSFDGYVFRNYSVPEIPDESFILIFSGYNGKLWFLSYTGYLCYLEGRRLHPYPLNDTIQQLAGRDFLHTIKVDSLDRVWFKGHGMDQLLCIDGDSIIYPDTTGPFTFQPGVFRNYYVSPEDPASGQSLYSREKLVYPALVAGSHFYLIRDSVYRLENDNRLSPLGPYKPGTGLQVNSHDVYVEPNGDIWLRKDLKGALHYSRGDYDRPVLYLAGVRLTRILKDREGNYWFATEGEGVYLVPSFNMNVFPADHQPVPNANVMAFAFRDREVIFSTSDNKIYKGYIRHGTITKAAPFISDDENLYGRDILWQDSGPVWILQSGFLRYSAWGDPMPLDMVILHKPYEATEFPDGSVAIATFQGFYTYKEGKLGYDSRKDMFLEHVQAIHQDENGVLWLGTVSGLYAFAGGVYEFLGEKHPALSGRIAGIKSSGEEVWVGTRENGIVVIRSDTLIHLGSGQGLNSNIIKSMLITDSIAWVGTNRGLNKIRINGIPSVSAHYNVWDGLPSNEINDIALHDSYLWLATNKGIASFRPEELKKPGIGPSLFMRNIYINGRDTSLQPAYRLTPHQNNLRLDYAGISFRDPGNILYTINITGSDKSRHLTTATSFSLPDLQAGQYDISIEACNADRHCSSLAQAVSFTIDKRFTETVWFRFFLIIVVVAVTGLITWLLLKGRQTKERLRREMLQSEQKALRAQMNPHFIFNSLNSIQYFLLENEHENADVYLASFSSLMRRTLENSKQNFIPLKEELETIGLYLELENLRFENKFEYQVIVEEGVDTAMVSIPPMILQPYLENAIWHGIMPKGERGRIIVRIKTSGEKLVKISIADNGIGREKSARVSEQRSGHRSTGMKNIEERIRLINRIHKTGMKVKITDLYDDNKAAAGTLIELFIPVSGF